MDSNSSIYKAAARFFSGTMISRGTGLLRDISMAYSFGTASPLAAFFTAFRLTHVPRRLLGEGGMQTAFIPLFEELKSKDRERAKAFFTDLNVLLSWVLIGLITLVMSILGLALYFFDLSPSVYDVVWLSFIMMPSLFFICLYGLNAGLLECEGSYFTPSMAPVAFNIVWVVATLMLSGLPPESAMVPLSLAITVACFGQWIMTVPKIKKMGFNLFQGFNLKSKDLKSLMKPLFLANLGILATQLNSAIDPLFARYANNEGPAWLWYAIRLEQLPLALFAIALSGALLPPLSRAAKSGDGDKFFYFLKTGLWRSFYLMAPITLAIFLLGHWSVDLLFGRGDFNAESVHGTTICLWGYGIGLLPQTWVLLLAPAYFALGDYKTPALASSLAVAVNMLFNSLFIFQLQWGPESVAYATSIASFFNAGFLAWHLFKSKAIKTLSLNVE